MNQWPAAHHKSRVSNVNNMWYCPWVTAEVPFPTIQVQKLVTLLLLGKENCYKLQAVQVGPIPNSSLLKGRPGLRVSCGTTASYRVWIEQVSMGESFT